MYADNIITASSSLQKSDGKQTADKLVLLMTPDNCSGKFGIQNKVNKWQTGFRQIQKERVRCIHDLI